MKNEIVGLRPGPLRIGALLIDPPLLLAPMAGITDQAYRRIMAAHGAGLVTTEMVSIQGLVRDQRMTWKLCDQDPPLHVPVAVQLFGNDPLVMAEAARRVESRGISIIDINAGCPVRKVARQGAGAKLMQTPDLLARMVEKTRQAVSIPVTVKVRLGWDNQCVNVVETARRLEAAGADAITVHARTAVQFYSGCADWTWIGRVKEAVSIPVIGNGDITHPALADFMLEQTGCDGVMIGRATQGNPWLLSATAARWGRTGSWDPAPGWDDLLKTVRLHLEMFTDSRPATLGHYRKLLIWYSKGCRNSSPLREQLNRIDNREDMLMAFERWAEESAATGTSFISSKIANPSASVPFGVEIHR